MAVRHNGTPECGLWSSRSVLRVVVVGPMATGTMPVGVLWQGVGRIKLIL